MGGNSLAGADVDSVTTGLHAIAIGGEAWATEDNAVVLGYNSYAQAVGATVLGSNAWTTKAATNSVSLGSGSLADRANSVSVGAALAWTDSAGVVHAAIDRQITNVAAGTQATDAVNKAQLDAVAAGLGSSVANVVSYDDATRGRITLAAAGTVIANVADGAVDATSKEAVNGSQLNATNNEVAAVEGRVDNVEGQIGSINSTLADSVGYDDATHGRITLGGAGGTVIANVADGELSAGSTEAVNGSQLNATNNRVTVVEGLVDAIGGRVDNIEGQLGSIGGVVANAVTYDDAGKGAISFGGSAGTRLSNVQAGTGDNDAVNLFQLSAVAHALGGGAGFSGGIFSAPSFSFAGASYGTVGATFDAISAAFGGFDSRLTALEEKPMGVPAGTGDGLAVGPGSHAADANDTAVGIGATVGADGSTAVGAGATITAEATDSVAVGEGSSVTAANGTAVGQGATVTAEGAVAIGQGSVADEANTVSVGSDGHERRVTNVAAGTSATDAVNLSQMQAGDAAAIASARQYTDATATQTLGQAKSYTDSRVAELNQQFTRFSDDLWMRLGDQDRRIDRQGAMGAAMTNMAMNAANARSPRGRVAIGAGWQNGTSALSIGYAKQLGDRASFSLSGAFSGSDRSAGVGFGVDL